MGLGDLLRMQARTPRSVLPPPRSVSRGTALRLTPALDARGLRGGMLSYDGQLLDDAQLMVAVARTAASLGARILTRVRAFSVRADGVSAEDSLSGRRLDIRARSVVNATGVWAGTLDGQITVRPSRGTHIVLDAGDLGFPQAALTIPHEESVSRYVFALPQQMGRVIVGLTDEEAPGPVPSVPEPTEEEILFLLATLNRVVRTPIRRDQVRGAFAGLRPLVDTGTAATADISRRHLVAESEAGFVNVLGGKLTTYRRMAEDAVDAAVGLRGLDAAASRTASLRLTDAARHDRGITRPDAAEPITDGLHVTRGDVESAVRNEGALTADDVLDRRTRIGLLDADRARSADTVEKIVAEALSTL